MLVKEVAGEFPGVRVAIEEYGNSPMAQKFGVRRYPVVFVNDVLLARPKDFGFGGPEDVSGGRYLPWREPASQRRFKEDLRTAVARSMAGERVAGHEISEVTTPSEALDGPAQMPALTVRTLADRDVLLAQPDGRATVIELWATWCPPCRSTLGWLSEFQKTHARDVRVVAVAVDSDPAEVRRMVGQLKPTYDVALGTPELVKAFGEVAAVPKLLVFDARGRLARVLHGAPPDLHAQIEAAVERALK